jgi:hypothetical protein
MYLDCCPIIQFFINPLCIAPAHFRRHCAVPSPSPVRGDIFVETNRKKIFKLRQERHLPRMANTYTQIYIHIVLPGKEYATPDGA